MSEIRSLVNSHVETLLREAEGRGVPAETVARILLSQVVEIYKRDRPIDDIAQELTFLADNLDDDQDYVFMRP